jgi:hypothetical protein
MTDDEILNQWATTFGYPDERIRVLTLARSIERSAREAAIDECMKVCRKRAQRAGTLGRQFEAIDCAEDIRALREEKP